MDEELGFFTLLPIAALALILLLITPCVMQCINCLVTSSLTTLMTRDTYQVMMNVRNMRTFAPTVVQSGQHVEQIIGHVTDTDAYDEHDYAHTY